MCRLYSPHRSLWMLFEAGDNSGVCSVNPLYSTYYNKCCFGWEFLQASKAAMPHYVIQPEKYIWIFSFLETVFFKR